jgi:hypothetical protein
MFFVMTFIACCSSGLWSSFSRSGTTALYLFFSTENNRFEKNVRTTAYTVYILYIYILALYIYIVYNQVFSHKSFEINGKSLDVCHVSELMSLLSLSAQRPRNQLNDAGGDYTPLYAQKIQWIHCNESEKKSAETWDSKACGSFLKQSVFRSFEMSGDVRCQNPIDEFGHSTRPESPLKHFHQVLFWSPFSFRWKQEIQEAFNWKGRITDMISKSRARPKRKDAGTHLQLFLAHEFDVAFQTRSQALQLSTSAVKTRARRGYGYLRIKTRYAGEHYEHSKAARASPDSRHLIWFQNTRLSSSESNKWTCRTQKICRKSQVFDPIPTCVRVPHVLSEIPCFCLAHLQEMPSCKTTQSWWFQPPQKLARQVGRSSIKIFKVFKQWVYSIPPNGSKWQFE